MKNTGAWKQNPFGSRYNLTHLIKDATGNSISPNIFCTDSNNCWESTENYELRYAGKSYGEFKRTQKLWKDLVQRQTSCTILCHVEATLGSSCDIFVEAEVKPRGAKTIQDESQKQLKTSILHHFEPSLGHLGTIIGHLWPSWSNFGASPTCPSWGYLGPSWSNLSWGILGSISVHFGAILGHLRTVLGASWDQELFRNPRPKMPVPHLRHLGLFWRPFWRPKLNLFW